MRLPMACRAIYLLAGLLAGVNSYRHFADRIPNGHNVPHPLDEDLQWYGVGHNNSMGTGVRNVFGEAFAKNGYNWNLCICEEDSDMDGRTNGEELGDPGCEWTEGEMPRFTTGITHPGICTPSEDVSCEGKNDWIVVPSLANQPCEGIDQPGIETVDIRFPATQVPSIDTSFYCQAFSIIDILPENRRNNSLHLIATNPITDNEEVMHHTLLYGCGEEAGPQLLEDFAQPVECGMATEICNYVVAGWSVGNDWACQNPNAGIPFGKDGVKYVILQHHWTNPQERPDFTDSSGLRLHYTENKREFDSGIWFTGTAFIEIPPGYLSVHAEGGCSVDCMQRTLQENIYITHIMPHMHYLGTAFMFQIIRDGEVFHESKVDTYFYETPEYQLYDPPLEVRPTDEIRVDCYYQSKTVDVFTHFGRGTYDEMCFAFITYYPYRAEAPLQPCITDRNGLGQCVGGITGDLDQFCDFSGSAQTLIANTLAMYRACDPSGIECLVGCKVAQAILKSHDCFTGPSASALTFLNARFTACQALQDCSQIHSILNAFYSCGPDPPSQPGDDSDGQCDRPIPTSAVGLSVNYIMSLFMMIIATLLM